MSKLTILLTAGLFVLGAALTLAAAQTTPSHPTGQPSNAGNASNNTHRPTDNPSANVRADWQNLSQAQKDAGLARADQHRLFAKFQYANGTASGRFVSFGLNPSTGAMTQFTV